MFSVNFSFSLITAGLGSGDNQQKKIRSLQKDLDNEKDKALEMEKELKRGGVGEKE